MDVNWWKQWLRKRFWLVTLSVLVVLSFLPVGHKRVLTYGTDTYNGHHPVFGSHVVSQSMVLPFDIQGVGALLVNLRHADQLPNAMVTITDNRGNVVDTVQIAPNTIHDDQLAWVNLHQVIKASSGPITVTLSASAGTASNPLGVRFDMDTKEVAVGVIDHVPVWRALEFWTQEHTAAAQLLWWLLGGACLGFLVWLGERASVWQSQRGWVMALVVLAGLTVAMRVPLLQQIDSVYGGDAYNYILKANAWIHGQDPLAADPRKGPLLALLLSPGFITGDPILWGRFISVTAATMAVILLVLLAAKAGMPRSLAWFTGLLLAVAQDFRWESIQGLANVLYAALIVAAALALWYAQRSTRKGYLTNALLGLATLTRFEGIMVAVIFTPAVWMYERLHWRRMAYVTVPLAILVGLIFIMWPFTGHLGVRTPADISGDQGLSLALSPYDWLQNFKLFRLFFGTTWILTNGVGNQWLWWWVGAAVGALLGWTRLAGFWQRLRAEKWLPWVAPVWLIGIIVADINPVLEEVSLLLTLLTGVGTAWLVMRRPKWAVPVLLMAVVQMIVITAILPKFRYYIQLLPFMALALMAGLSALGQLADRRRSSFGVLLAAGMVVALVFFTANDALSGELSDYNSKSQANTVMVGAAKLLQPTTGLVAVYSDDLSMRVYVGDRRLVIYRAPANKPGFTEQEQLTWLMQRQAKYVVETDFYPLFSVAAHRPDVFQPIGHFTTRYGAKAATVYRVVPTP